MPPELENAEVAALARRLAERTGETVAEAVAQALRERLARVEDRASDKVKRELSAIRRRCAELPVRDARPADEILGYDENGLPR